MNRPLAIAILGMLTAAGGCAGEGAPDSARWSVKIADAFIARHPGAVTYDSLSPSTRWNYEQGLMLTALGALWKSTGGRVYFDFVRENMERYIRDDGTIETYKAADDNLDNIAPGRILLTLYDETGLVKYRKAADLLREQLRHQPRTKEGGFWHKKIYPYQMWLDGLYMAEPFYAQYSIGTGDTAALDDVASQFIFMAVHARDEKTGLFHHGWDESGEQRWADRLTRCSAAFWSRSMGWYLMGLVDVLDEFPADHPRRGELLEIFRSLAEAVARYRDGGTGLWYQVPDQPTREGNYAETSASAMFIYSFARGARRGFLDHSYLAVARSAFDSLVAHAVRTGSDGRPDVSGTCRSAGLGGDPYRDGSYEYYVSEPVRLNDMKGLGSFILAAIELEEAALTAGSPDQREGEPQFNRKGDHQ